MICTKNSCLSLVKVLLEGQFKKEKDFSAIDAAEINFKYLEKYFYIMKIPETDKTYYLRRIKAHMDELIII